MKRFGLILLALLLAHSSRSPLDGRVARGQPPAGRKQVGAVAENAAISDSTVAPRVINRINRVIHAKVVAIDQPYVVNRLGASQPAGMIFVLKDDLVPKIGNGPATHANFKLRHGKRPRPLVLRMNVGDLLEIHFENWLQSLSPAPQRPTATQRLAQLNPFQQRTRYAGIHVNGLELVPRTRDDNDIKSDGSWVGANKSGLLPPRAAAKADEQSITYRLYARESGTFLLTSGADTTVHQLDAGLFGAVNVQPQGAEWYRSQTTQREMEAATLEVSELRSHEQALDRRVPPREPEQQQVAPLDEAPNAPGTDRKLQPRRLRTVSGEARAQVVANVYVDNATGLIYSRFRHPLINYHAVFNDDDRMRCPTAVPGKPVLSMLKAVIPDPNSPKNVHPLQRADGYTREIESLDSGLVTSSLRDVFREDPLKVELAAEATVAQVAGANKYSWVVTNSGKPTAQDPDAAGKTYLVQGNEATRTVTIQECELHLVYSDLTGLITGPNAGKFPYHQESPDFYTNPASPDRRQPYREFTIIYHQAGNTVQAFPQWNNNNLFNAINAGMDQFGINYGIAAIGPEIVANRLGVGPMGNDDQPLGPSGPKTAPKANQPNDAVDLKYEEFFLSSWCVGDPAMVVDVPANTPNAMVSNPEEGSEIPEALIHDNPVRFVDFKALRGTRPTKAFFPDDPSNVYHSYMRDHTKMRILHAGPGPAHVHHLHAHQWLKTPNSPDATYLDSQLILPGSAYTLEITYHGSGNRNQTVGDSIFHCHFYPHFAKGMWSLWRVHDTFEAGTELDRNGVAVTCRPNRALPDGEILAGTPTPALIPLPTLGMAPIPAEVQVADLAPWYGKDKGMGRRIHVIPKNWKTILKDFDKDNDGTLSDQERRDWDKAIADAENANRASGRAYGEAGYRWIPYALYDNPGYPFFIPGLSGHRPPHPPMDMAWKEEGTEKKGAAAANPAVSETGAERRKATWTKEEIEDELGIKPASRAAVKVDDVQYLDGGLPRHVVLGGDLVAQYTTRWDFSKDFVKSVTTKGSDGKETTTHVGGLYAFQLPEDGTPIERAAMRTHATRTHATALPENGDAGNFILNGLPPVHGAPYADPSVTDDGNSSGVDRRYQAAVIQTDMVLNKKGWHYPQSRFLTLWEDVARTVRNERAPEPLFIRTATNDATELWHTNLVPNYYELDDFQVRTPTDVIGQHIHLVKFDVTSSDGSGNGWNYEDGTFGPGEVRDRIHAIMNAGGLYGFDRRTGFVDKTEQKAIAVWPNRFAYPKRECAGDDANGLFGPPPANQNWEGAMTTIQRWAIDPLLNWQGHDRTLRTVFTHDHFGPSTHQQVGLYAGVLVEPQGSQWYLPDGNPMYVRTDGGPTSWQAMIVTANPANSHREYAIEFQDMHLAYTAESKLDPKGSNALFRPSLEPAALALMKQQIPTYDGDKDDAPAAFYIGQTSAQERLSLAGLINDLDATHDGEPVPAGFLQSGFFPNYGIPLDKNTKVFRLAKGDPLKGFLNGQWLFVRSATDADGRPVVNGGDYYILQATMPITTRVANQDQTTPGALSVYTPSVPPGFTDPAHAVNAAPGDSIISTQQIGGASRAVNVGNIGTPRSTVMQGASNDGSDVSNSKFGNGAPFPTLVSTRANGTYSMNYRNEPVQLRVKPGNAQQTEQQKDLAFAFSSIARNDAQLNEQPVAPARIGTANPYKFPPPLEMLPPNTLGGPQGTDPFTPLIRGYVGDDIQIRALVGAHLQSHPFSIHGVHWLSQPSYHNSGFRNVQSMGISEHYEMRFQMPSAVAQREGTNLPAGADYFYSASTGATGLSNGLWGIIRSYNQEVPKLKTLVNNPGTAERKFPEPLDFQKLFEDAAKDKDAVKEFKVVATTAAESVEGGKLIYHSKGQDPNGLDLVDEDAVIFVLKDDLDKGKLKKVEPLILRAAAGQWIKVTLINGFPKGAAGSPFNKPFRFRYGNPFNGLPRLPGDQAPTPAVGPVDLNISRQVGLHPQLLAYDVTRANGINVGFNPTRTVGPGDSIEYYWYAGEIVQTNGQTDVTPVEFGATNLVGADMVLQTQFGLVGSLIVEPPGTTATEDPGTHAFATINDKHGRPLFRECVLVMQNMVADKTPGRADDAAPIGGREGGYGAVNFKTETFSSRGLRTLAPIQDGFSKVFTNGFAGPARDPQTPVFIAKAGTPVRFRVVMPSTTAANSAAQPVGFTIHGHGWQDEPYIKNSTLIGHNDMAQFIGSQEVTVTQKYDIVIDSAGGPFRVPGDYLYQAFNQEQKMGIWGLFRVEK